MITNKDIRVENGFLIINGDKFPLDGQSPETIMEIVEDNSDTTPTENSTAPITSGGVYTALGTKQDTLTFDNVPTENSDNAVKSGGVFAALFEKTNIGAASTNATTVAELVDYCRNIGSADIGHVHFGISNYSISQLFGTSRFTFLYRFSSANYGWILCISDNSTMSGIKLLQVVQYPDVYLQTPTMTIDKIL